jgi:phosphopantetheinyl transferase (holo-ACP synthase)
VRNDGSYAGKPEIRLHGNAKAEFERILAKSISLSMSHCVEYAVATVLIET